MKTVMNDIKSTLSPEVVSNFIVVLTKCDIYSCSFEVSSLEEFGISIRSEHTFIFDNPYAKWNITKEKNLRRSSLEEKSEFESAFETLNNIFSAIESFPQVNTAEFGKYVEVIEDVDKYVVTLRLNLENRLELERLKKKMKKEMKEEIEKLSKAKEKFNFHPKKFPYRSTNLVSSSESKNMICRVPNCNSNCHMDCRCWFTGLLRQDRKCICFEKGFCTKCDHHYMYHCKRELYYKDSWENIEFSRIDENNIKDRVKEHESSIKKKEKKIAASEDKNKDEIKSLFMKLDMLQKVASNPFYTELALEMVETWKTAIHEMPEFNGKEEILEMFTSTIGT